MAVNFKSKKDIGPRINEQITASEVRLISSNGKQLGILSIREALIQAEDEGFDLVEVSAAVPSVSVPLALTSAKAPLTPTVNSAPAPRPFVPTVRGLRTSPTT